MTNYPKGSEWRLWDLHIHTPASFDYDGALFTSMTDDQKNESLSQIINNINESDVAVYAINDYWTFEGYLNLRKAELGGEPINKTVFPGIEIRLEAASDHRLNAHVIFSDEVTEQELTDFKSALKIKVSNRSLSNEALIDFANQLPSDKAREHGVSDKGSATQEQLFELGAKTAEITRESFSLALDSISQHKRLVMIPYSCYGGIEDIDWKNQASEDIFLLRLADIIEDRNLDNAKLFAGIKTTRNASFIDDFQESIGGQPKPCVSGSDGHSISSFKNWRADTANKKTWIKSDPTFEGLRQILFEPHLRVNIQADCPELEYSKPFISSIAINRQISPFPQNDKFDNPNFDANKSLVLNRDLTCIIGGRGAGKSTLIGYLGQAFGGSSNSNYELSEHFSLVYHKDNDSASSHMATDVTSLPYVYIGQNEVKEKINLGTVGDEIKKMLGLADLSFDTAVDVRVHKLLAEVSTVNIWFNQRNEKDELIYDEDKVKRQLQKFESLLAAITTEQNQEKLQRFTLNISKTSKIKKKLNEVDEINKFLSDFKATYNEKIRVLDDSIPPIELTSAEEQLNARVETWTADLAANLKENETIKNDFSDVFSGDLSGLLENAEAYRNAIEKLKAKLDDIKKKNKELETAFDNLEQIPDLIRAELLRIKSAIDQKWQTINNGQDSWTAEQKSLMKKILNDRNIKLEGELVFNKTEFIEQIKKHINLRSFRETADQSQEERITAHFGINDLDSYLEFMKVDLYSTESESFVTGDIGEVFHNLSIRSKYLNVDPVITYNGRPLENLSVGQKGTVYLCLKLATQAFTQPLIFDQPEDDLDNEFIIEELVDIFKSIKQFRQVILVTHNANLVVNSDSEQVIISSNEDGLISYSSGSLENQKINKNVRRILEGGDSAFRKREQRYNLATNK